MFLFFLAYFFRIFVAFFFAMFSHFFFAFYQVFCIFFWTIWSPDKTPFKKCKKNAKNMFFFSIAFLLAFFLHVCLHFFPIFLHLHLVVAFFCIFWLHFFLLVFCIFSSSWFPRISSSAYHTTLDMHFWRVYTRLKATKHLQRTSQESCFPTIQAELIYSKDLSSFLRLLISSMNTTVPSVWHG